MFWTELDGILIVQNLSIQWYAYLFYALKLFNTNIHVRNLGMLSIFSKGFLQKGLSFLHGKKCNCSLKNVQCRKPIQDNIIKSFVEFGFETSYVNMTLLLMHKSILLKIMLPCCNIVLYLISLQRVRPIFDRYLEKRDL